MQNIAFCLVVISHGPEGRRLQAPGVSSLHQPASSHGGSGEGGDTAATAQLASKPGFPLSRVSSPLCPDSLSANVDSDRTGLA